MPKEKRRNWLDKISKWILDAFPAEETSPSRGIKTRSDAESSRKKRQKIATSFDIPQTIAISNDPIHKTKQDLLTTQELPSKNLDLQPKTEKNEAVKSSDCSVKTIKKAWQAFELAWANAELGDQYFLEQKDLLKTLELIDRSFEEELIEWLFQLCTKPEALTDLAKIIERGQVKPTDNIDAIRAFAYVSVAVAPSHSQSDTPLEKTRQSTSPAPDQKERPGISSEKDLRSDKLSDLSQPTELQADPYNSPIEATKDGDQLNHIRPENVEKNTLAIGNLPLEKLDLSVRASNCLKRANIHSLIDLAEKTEESLIEIKNFGQKSADEVIQAVEKRGLSFPFTRSDVLGGDLSNEPEEPQEWNRVEDDSNELSSLGLSARALNCLYRGKIYSIANLIENTESQLLSIQNLGPSVIQEVNSALSKHGLSLTNEYIKWKSETESILNTHQQEEEEDETAWHNLKCRIEIQNKSEKNIFESAIKVCKESESAPVSAKLFDNLVQLNASLELISQTLAATNPAQLNAIESTSEELKQYITEKFIENGLSYATTLSKRIISNFNSNQERNWVIYLLRCSGITLNEIGEQQQPPISRERVRQMESKVTKILGIKATELAEWAQERKEGEDQLAEMQALKAWMQVLDRLPTPDDQLQTDENNSELWEEITQFDLKGRYDLLSKHKLQITDSEYNYQYRYIANQLGPVGNGYWRDFNNLKQFVLRHAIALGEPELMPKQTSFPDAVRGVVTSYGGQSKVAKRIGLKYQGQLVGSDGGRRYWTEKRLEQLLNDTNQHHQRDADAMPSYGDVLDFFSETSITEYHNKKPPSAIAALTKQGELHWSEVAKRFNKRFISGESQKSVTLSYIKAFVRDLGEHLESLSPSELFVLFQAQGINRGEKEKFSRTFDALVDAVQSGVVDKEQLRSWADNNEVESIDELLELGAELKAESTIEEKEQKLLERRSKKLMEEFPNQEGESAIHTEDLPKLEPVRILKALDKAADIVNNSANDSDKVEFLKTKAAAKLWDACFLDEAALIKKLKAFTSDEDSYSQEVQAAFLEEYEGARSLPIPDTYAFKDLKGKFRNPKLMQRLVAFRLKRDLRLLNLSGTGTGKTLSAIYAAQICGCKRLLISCPNGVIESWKRAFASAFPSANLIIKPKGWEIADLDEGVNVVIVNHERFQDRLAQQLLGFCINYQADMIVVDEIHQSKRRTSDTSSQRRKLMNEFIRISANINTELRVLGLSATPVINNLYEGRSLLELICQETMEGIGETVDLNSCMNLYQQFVVHGIRMNPGQLSRTKLIKQEIDATSLLPQIVWATKKGTYHDIEQLLVEPKVAALGKCLKHGVKTIIFVTYIKNTIRPITNWLSKNAYSYSLFTGDEKEAQEEGFQDSLDEFIRGKSEVLVASIKCAGTGVDGLQSVCNRAIFFQLPWTSTEFEQTIGRLDRDGTDFESVDVYLPMTDVLLPDGERWSWCRSKLDRIESKRDIAKAAVDGEIPDAASLISPSEASKYWLKWLQKLEEESAKGAV